MTSLLLAASFLTLATGGDSDSLTTHNGPKNAIQSRTVEPTRQGNFTPRGSVNKTGIAPNTYHNEQDNFKRNEPIIAPQPQSKPDPHADLPTAQHMNKTNVTDPSVNFSFNAETCPSNDPPDNTVAVSAAGDIVSAVNCGIFFYNSSGTLVGQNTYPTFFNTGTDEFSDPRLVYDPYSDRFIFFIQFGHTAATSVIFIAFSNTNDPTGQWHYYSYGLSSFMSNVWFDYPSVGINQNDYCVTGNLFDDGGNGVGNLVFLFNKADGYANAGAPRNNFWTNVKDGNNTNGFTIAPATAAQSTTYSGNFYLVSTYSGGGSSVSLYNISGSAGSSPTINSVGITTTQSYAPSAAATQPNGLSLANYKAGCRVQNACYLNGIVHFVFAADYSSGGSDYNSVYYNRINVSNNTISQNWSFLSGSNYNYPSIASYGTSTTDQTVIIGFLKSDASTNPEVRFKYFDNNMDQLGSIQIRQGDAAVNYTWASEQRWGDYTGTQRRYGASQPEVWVCGSYSNASSIWQTNIAQITGYPGLVAISEVSLDGDMVVYPNPVKDQLYIKGDLRNITGFPTVTDIEGRNINVDMTRRDNDMYQLDVKALSSGIYIVRINNGKTIKFTKE